MNIYEGLVAMFLNKVREEGADALIFLCSSQVPQKVFMMKYKSLPPIEKLPQAEKIEMKKYVHENFPGQSPEFKLQAAKIIYVIGELI